MFLDMDVDGSGDVDLQELMEGLSDMGMKLTDEEFLAFFNDLDKNNDQKLTREEFVGAITEAVQKENDFTSRHIRGHSTMPIKLNCPII